MPILDYGQLPEGSIDEAARAGLVESWRCSQNRRECGGAIYQYLEAGGRAWYFRSTVETSDKPFGVEIKALGEKPPPGMTLVADFHTHICSQHNRPFAEFFSVGDVIVNQAMHTVGYILDGCTGAIHRFDPRQDDVDDEEIDFVSGKKLYLTIGHLSGWIDLRRVK